MEARIEMDTVALTGNLNIESVKQLRISSDTRNLRRYTADEALLVSNAPGVVGCLVRAR